MDVQGDALGLRHVMVDFVLVFPLLAQSCLGSGYQAELAECLVEHSN